MSNSTTESNKYHGKPCVKCGSTLRYKSDRGCVPCKLECGRKWYEANRSRHRECGHKWDKANRKKRREITRKWQHANKEVIRIRGKKYRQANQNKTRENKQKWTTNNPGKTRAMNQRYRAHKRGNESEPYDFKAICAHYDNRCVKCGEIKPLTIDHILPVSKGGPDIASNIQPLCKSCNSSKWAKNIDYRPDAGPLRWIQRKLFGGK